MYILDVGTGKYLKVPMRFPNVMGTMFLQIRLTCPCNSRLVPIDCKSSLNYGSDSIHRRPDKLAGFVSDFVGFLGP